MTKTRRKFFLLLLLGAAFKLAATDSITDPAQDAPILGSQAAVLLDAATGTLLYTKNQDQPIPPASLTKLMTIHLALEEISAGRAASDEIVPLPRESWAINQPPRSSVMHLAAGQRVSLGELLLGLAVPSGNDAAVAVALRFAPTVAEFADRMNREARRLGMTHTLFVEPSGISENNQSTALDLARFCREYLIRHPEALEALHSVPAFAYPKPENLAERYRDDPKTIIQSNHNRLLRDTGGVDGLKTGYIDEAGYNIALTAEREGTRLVAVILGAPAAPGGDRIRDQDGRALLDWGFRHFKTQRTALPPLPAPRIWKSARPFAQVLPRDTGAGGILTGGGDAETPGSLSFTTYTNRGTNLRWEWEIPDPLIAPFPAESVLGNLYLYDETGELRRIALICPEAIAEGNLWQRVRDSLALFWRRVRNSLGLFTPREG
jgi:D-alanyl-D-alanine carboxypeptidase (penicillin-binding protein 5/6)